MDRQQYCKEENHLPEFLKDFHDQKNIFKILQEWGDNQENKVPNNWIDNHIFTIDFFLWAMALHGYKLQKIRAKHVEFLDIDAIKQNLIG